MATTSTVNGTIGASGGLLDRERIIAQAGFNRWLVPPAALAIHLCIGMAYGFSVFWLPLSRSIGINKFVACPDQTLVSLIAALNRKADILTATTAKRRSCSPRAHEVARLYRRDDLPGEN